MGSRVLFTGFAKYPEEKGKCYGPKEKAKGQAVQKGFPIDEMCPQFLSNFAHDQHIEHLIGRQWRHAVMSAKRDKSAQNGTE
jgi:hypothetical protein